MPEKHTIEATMKRMPVKVKWIAGLGLLAALLAPIVWASHADKDIGQDLPDVTISPTPDAGHAWDAAAGDIDGNGQQDLVFRGQTSGGQHYLAIFFNATLDALRGRNLSQADVIIRTAKKYPWNWNFIKRHTDRFLAIGDINGDGRDDIFFGLPGAVLPGGIIDEKGEAYVVLGRPRSEFGSIWDFAITPPDFTFFGSDPGDRAGWSVALGDVNGDGRKDAIIGAPLGDGPSNALTDGGEAYVVTRMDWSQKTMTLTGANVDLYLYGETAQKYGDAVFAANLNGDINSETGRPIEDVIVAAWAVPDIPVKMIFGRSSERRLQGSADWESTFPVGARHATFAVGDVNGDGIDDLLSGDGKGRAFLKYGSRNPLSSSADTTVIQIDSDDFLGQSNVLADMDGDGFDDLVMLAPTGQGRNNQYAGVWGSEGELFIVWGASNPLPATIDLETDLNHFSLWGSDGSGSTGIKTNFQWGWGSVWGSVAAMELDGTKGDEVIWSDTLNTHIYRIGPHTQTGGVGGSTITNGESTLQLLTVENQ